MDFRYGYSFYPEHCADMEEIKRDFEIIKKSGANVVRMAEFAWDRLEPSDGQFDFSWLEEIVTELGKSGIKTILCTPTACPPAWLYNEHDVKYVNPLGYEKPFGARRHYCPTKPDFVFHAKRIAEEMAKHFGDNPYVYGWQVDNEFGHNASGRCRCPHCAKLFREHLRKKFDNDITKLNKAFGTYFWAQTYNDFEEIDPPTNSIEKNTVPKYNSFFDNPSLRLEFERFSSDSFVKLMDIQASEIRKYSDRPITTNSTGYSTNNIDYFELYKKADVYGIDSYPSLFHGNNDYCAVNFAAGRGYKDKEFWVMEFSIGGGHTTGGGGRIQPYPGAIRQAVVYSYARGASAVVHFQYKTFRSGAEQLNYALIDADRVPRRRYFEFQETVRTMERLEDIIGKSKAKKSKAAIVFNYSDMWATMIKPLNTQYQYLPCVKELYSVMNEYGIAPEIISEEASFDDYDLLITVMPVTMTQTLKDKLKSFVNGGGTLITTVGTAIKDECNLGIDTTLPGGLTDLFGVEVQEIEPLMDGINDTTVVIDNNSYNAKYWLEQLKCTTAESIGIFGRGYKKGTPLITRNKYGNGNAYYMGTFLERDTLGSFINEIAASAGVVPEITINKDTDYAVRTSEDGTDYIFIFNHLMEENNIKLDGKYLDVLTNKTIANEYTLDPKGFICVIKQ